LATNSREAPTITWAERDRIARRNRALLDEELLSQRLVFESRPYEAHVQFSNVCNISCIMCWDGENPPAKKMSPELLDKVAAQLAPHLSVITPHEASEPTVVTWDETVKLARDYSVELALTTNVQEFDEEKFFEAKDHLQMVVMSIDSHVPVTFAKIRLGAKVDKIFRNAETIARLCREHGVECIGQAVFMTENAPMMPETIAWLADIGVTAVSVIALNDTNRHSGHLDAALHFSAEYLGWIKSKCVAVAEEKKIRLGWFLSDYESLDFRDAGSVGLKESRAWNDRWDSLMALRHPGYCRFAYDRLRIEVDGNVSPCGLDSRHELELGSLREQDFDEIWNGPTAQDLRRAHYTWDYPSLCKTCRFSSRVPARSGMRFLGDYLRRGWQLTAADVPATLRVEAPEHMVRQSEPPVIRVIPDLELSSYVVVLSLGGQLAEVDVLEIEPIESLDGALELPFPQRRWEALRSNVGYWWAVIGFCSDRPAPVVRSSEVRCLIRHEPIARIEGSRLEYPDEGHFPAVYLGGERQVGWTERGSLPDRPPLSGAGAPKPAAARPRFAKLRKSPDVDMGSFKMAREAYHELIGQIRAVVNTALPPDALVAVVSKGDAELLDFDGRTAWHFPCDETRGWAGFHPEDSDWAIGHLERMRDDGAEFLVLPAPHLWWLDHYPQFAAHLDAHFPAIVEDRERCAIFDLRPTRAKPGSGAPTPLRGRRPAAPASAARA
jgi:radical SAM protein with 4Fe4S-binding SPASM domain